MIYYEPNEALEQSKLPQTVIERGVEMPGLEESTGADLLIVPEDSDYEKAVIMQSNGKSLMDISKSLDIKLPDLINLINSPLDYAIPQWLFAGAILVQRKSGYDFVQSMGARLNDSIAKMCGAAPSFHQRVILVTGVFSKQGDMLVLDGKITNWKYNSFSGAKSSIWKKGAVVEFEANDDCILDWIRTQEKQLLSYKHEDTKWIVSPVYFPPDLPSLDDPLQLVRPVTDGRLSIINIPGWGVEKVNALWEYVKKCLNKNTVSLFEMLSYATADSTAKHLKGVGGKLIENARNYVGLQKGEYLCVNQNNVIVQKS